MVVLLTNITFIPVLCSYLESGRRVMDLFRARGWTTIITNNLVGYVLSYTTFTVGVLTGCTGLALERLTTWHYGAKTAGDSFLLGPVPFPGAWAFAYVILCRGFSYCQRRRLSCIAGRFCCQQDWLFHRDMGLRHHAERTFHIEYGAEPIKRIRLTFLPFPAA